MFEPIVMNQTRSRQSYVPPRRDPFMFQTRNQMPPARSAMNISRFLPTVGEQSFTLSKGMTGFSKVLENVQQVLRVVETTTPMIKEYGPMIKNLPAMYKMVKAFKDIDSISDTMEEKGEDNKKSTSYNQVKVGDAKETKSAQIKSDGTSVPKLYI